jgi:hypothetical protein
MRRQFRKDILITAPPPKPKPKKRRRKNPNKKCEDLRLLMRGWISMVGAENIDRKVWARVCDVHLKTLNKWIEGYPPKEDRIYCIARYLAPKLHMSKQFVARTIHNVLDAWRASK